MPHLITRALSILAKKKVTHSGEGCQQPRGRDSAINALELIEVAFFFTTLFYDAPDAVEKRVSIRRIG